MKRSDVRKATQQNTQALFNGAANILREHLLISDRQGYDKFIVLLNADIKNI